MKKKLSHRNWCLVNDVWINIFCFAWFNTRFVIRVINAQL
jgi:hypothetical protein